MHMRFLTASTLLLAFTAVLPAQTNPGANPPRTSPTQPTAGTPKDDVSQAVDKCFARYLALSNGHQVALAEFAKDRAQDQRVKDLVAVLKTGHEQSQAKLAKLSPLYTRISADLRTAARTTPDVARNEGTKTVERVVGNKVLTPTSDTRIDTDGSSIAATQDLVDQMFLIEQTAAANCLRMTMAELEGVPADRFDMALIGSELGGHIQMIARLEAVQPYVSSEMRPMLDQCLETARSHMNEARKLCKAVEQEQSPETKSNQ